MPLLDGTNQAQVIAFGRPCEYLYLNHVAYDEYGFHGTYWHNNFGTPMSRGRVNLTIDDAKWLYDWASVGTKVSLHE